MFDRIAEPNLNNGKGKSSVGEPQDILVLWGPLLFELRTMRFAESSLANNSRGQTLVPVTLLIPALTPGHTPSFEELLVLNLFGGGIAIAQVSLFHPVYVAQIQAARILGLFERQRTTLDKLDQVEIIIRQVTLLARLPNENLDL